MNYYEIFNQLRMLENYAKESFHFQNEVRVELRFVQYTKAQCIEAHFICEHHHLFNFTLNSLKGDELSYGKLFEAFKARFEQWQEERFKYVHSGELCNIVSMLNDTEAIVIYEYKSEKKVVPVNELKERVY